MSTKICIKISAESLADFKRKERNFLNGFEPEENTEKEDD